MSKNDQIQDRYPSLFTYGGRHKFMGPESGTETTFEDRIKSVWPFVVRRVLRFVKTLKPRELCNYDAEDILSEVLLRLVEKDDKWTPDRGRYITFAGVIIEHEFQAIRDKARTVHAPRNSSSRLEQYANEAVAGTLSAKQSKTAADIRRTRNGTFGLGSEASGGDNTGQLEWRDTAVTLADESEGDACEQAMRLETANENVARFRSAVRKLDTAEAQVLLRLTGANGFPPETMFVVAWSTAREVSEVRRLRDSGMAKIRHQLMEALETA